MSQAAIKPSRPPVVALPSVASVRKASRPNTPQTEKTDTRSATPKVDIIEESPSKSKRRVSNDSSKARGSPRVVDEKPAKSENGAGQDQTNGTNGNHKEAAAAGAEKKVETAKSSKKETPKKETPKKETDTKNTSDDEMEALVVTDTVESILPDTPPKQGRKTVTATRVLTPRQGPPAARAKPFATPEQAEKQQQQQSSNNDQSTVTEKIPGSPVVVVAAVTETPPPPTRISGRRSTRPIKEIQLTHKRANDSTSSLNATVGSSIHNDSISTPYVMKVGERRRFEDDDGFVDTPSKRPRIDFAGYLSYALTPVTLMRSGLARLGLSSTPRKLDVDTSLDEDKIADVSSTDVTKAEEAMEEVDLKVETIDDVKDNVVAEEEEARETKNREKCIIM